MQISPEQMLMLSFIFWVPICLIFRIRKPICLQCLLSRMNTPFFLHYAQLGGRGGMDRHWTLGYLICIYMKYCVCMYMHIHMCVYPNTYTFLSAVVSKMACMFIYIHTHISIYTHTHHFQDNLRQKLQFIKSFNNHSSYIA